MLRQTRLLVGPEHFVCLVPCMAVESCGGVEGALIGDRHLMHCIVIDLPGLILRQQHGGSEYMVRQPHEDAVEPHLITIDGFVPEDPILHRAGLLLQLPHHGLHGQPILLLLLLLIHPRHEMSRADVVEVVVFQLVAPNLSTGVNHRVGIFLTIVHDGLVTIFQIGVQHGLQFDAHHVTPFRLFRKVQQVTLRGALHFRGSHPLAVMLVGRLLQAKRPIDKHPVQRDVARLARDGVALSHSVEAAVAHGDVMHIGVLFQTNHLHSVFGLLAGDILHQHIPHRWVKSPAAHLVVLIVEVDFQHRLSALAHLDVAHEDILYHTSSARVRLDAQHTVQVGRVHRAVVGKHVAASSADFRADDHTAMPILHLAVSHDDVLTGHGASASVAVASAFDGNAVIARVEKAVFDEHTVARFGVAPVAVGAIVVDVHTPHRHIGALQWMDDPERRAEQGHILYQHTLTLVEADELRTHPVGGPKSAQHRPMSFPVYHRLAVFTILQQARTPAEFLAHRAFLPAILCGSAPRPPGLAVPASVDGTPPRDGNVVGTKGIDARRQIVAVQALPRSFHDRVERRLKRKLQPCLIFHHKIHPTLQFDGPREESLSGRHSHPSATPFGTLVDGPLNGLLILCSRCRWLSPKLGDGIVLLQQFRPLDASFNLLIQSRIPCLCHRMERQKRGEKKQVIIS